MKQEVITNILETLEEQKKEEGTLPLLLEFYEKLLDVQFRFPYSYSELVTQPDIMGIEDRLNQRMPALHRETFNLEWPLVLKMYEGIVDLFLTYPELFDDTIENLNRKNESGVLTRQAVEVWLFDNHLPETLLPGVSSNLKLAIIQATMHPFLKAYAETITDHISQENWRHNYCPVCGWTPDISVLKGDNGERWLVCSRCDTEWLFQRLECAYCGNQEQTTISLLSDENEHYRLYLCEKCKSYLKAVDTRKTGGRIPLPLERFYTIDLDNQAQELGYHPG